MKRTHNNGELRINNVGETVGLNGWVAKTRNLGGLLFIDLRDRYGITQVIIRPENPNYEIAKKIRNEFVLYINGEVVERESKNPNLPTGDIEIIANEIKILNEAETTPLIIADDTDALEDTRMVYRYLDLRRPVIQKNFILRHKVSQSVRNYLNENDFLELETPILTKSTPEGARDYLVPSRVHPGEFYALPQSPQIFKQLFMVSGFEKYYQIAKCFRDEDLRADRQPEFTQIDIETSFMSEEQIRDLTEEMLVRVMKETMNTEIPRPFPILTYDEAMTRFGSDKPDTRFEMELIDLSEIVKNSGFGVFSGAVSSGGEVKCIVAKGAKDSYSRKDIDKLTDFVKKYRAKGLAWLKHTEEGLTGPIAKFFSDEEKQNIIKSTNSESGDLLLFAADKKSVVADSLGALRNKLGKELGLIDESKFNFLWVVDWPLFEYDDEDQRFYAAHHPFTSPKESDIELMDTDPKSVKAVAYDVVLNGFELGGGSLRIYRREMQEKMFNILGFTNEEANEQFGFLLEAFKYGTPPHGGIALGLDRLIMILAGADSLRDVIAFPKNSSAVCTMTEAPNEVANNQLDELGIQKKRVSKVGE